MQTSKTRMAQCPRLSVLHLLCRDDRAQDGCAHWSLDGRESQTWSTILSLANISRKHQSITKNVQKTLCGLPVFQVEIAPSGLIVSSSTQKSLMGATCTQKNLVCPCMAQKDHQGEIYGQEKAVQKTAKKGAKHWSLFSVGEPWISKAYSCPSFPRQVPFVTYWHVASPALVSSDERIFVPAAPDDHVSDQITLDLFVNF